jgi:hypothetical protein
MLTIERLKELPASEIFASGVVLDGTSDFNITGKPIRLRWVAKRGYIDDWAIYVGPEKWEPRRIAEYGNKVHFEKNIRYLVHCTDDAFRRYRH